MWDMILIFCFVSLTIFVKCMRSGNGIVSFPTLACAVGAGLCPCQTLWRSWCCFMSVHARISNGSIWRICRWNMAKISLTVSAIHALWSCNHVISATSTLAASPAWRGIYSQLLSPTPLKQTNQLSKIYPLSRITVKEDTDKIPAENISEITIKLSNTEQLFSVARELENSAYSYSLIGFDELSTETKTFLGGSLDFIGINRKAFADSWNGSMATNTTQSKLL